MIKGKFATIFDIFCLSFIIFLISFFWINKLFKINTLSLILSFILYILFFIFFTIITQKKYKVKIKNKKEKELYLKTKNSLKYLSIYNTNQYFEKLLSVSYLGNNIYKNNKSFFYINFYNTLNCYDFVIANNFYLQADKNFNLCFICENINDEFKSLVSNSPINYNIFYFDDIYPFIKNNNLFLESKELLYKKNNNKFLSIKNSIKNTLINIKFRSTFFSGLSLTFLSIFIPFSLYYLIIGSMLLFLSFLSLFFKPKNDKYINNHKSTIEDYFTDK